MGGPVSFLAARAAVEDGAADAAARFGDQFAGVAEEDELADVGGGCGSVVGELDDREAVGVAVDDATAAAAVRARRVVVELDL